MSIKTNRFLIDNKSISNYKKLGKHLLASDLILILLSISPIKGNTKMQKQVFLAWKQFFEDSTLDPAFFAYKYGAYSRVVEDSITILRKQKLIDVNRRKGEGTIFLINDRGLEQINAKIRQMDIDLTELSNKKIDWDEWSPKGIIRYVYRKYPEYSSETVVPSLKW